MTEPIDLATCTEAQLWRHVAAHLDARGITAVLVGGAVAAVYTEGAYRSGDLDFVQQDLFGVPVDDALPRASPKPRMALFVRRRKVRRMIQRWDR